MRAGQSFVATLLVAIAACTEAPTAPRPAEPLTPDQAAAQDALLRALRSGYPFVQPAPAGSPPVLVGAGDIARCDSDRDEATAALLDNIRGTVFAAGDNVYQFGTPAEYAGCYHPSWGRHKDRTRPAAGNHEYMTPGAGGYFTYFGPGSNPPFGYYSYNLGSWHVVVINSTPQVYMCWPPEVNEVQREWWWGPPQLRNEPSSPTAGRACAGDVIQQLWLVADLTAHRNYRCTIAYFHHPRFSSGQHGNHYQMQRIWDILYRFNVDVVVSGHDHVYERFAPQDPEGRADEVRGIRQFTVGTGGTFLTDFRPQIEPNSEARQNSAHGVIKLSLNGGGYDWEFVPVPGTPTNDPKSGHRIRDAGSGSCH